ncbi:MAG: hypothetical protein A2600_01335 [Candidatus Lambdaproteobacteria bacterium RIFOXYD1_FULL_56_27]|uniref:M23ase beta-sheet core domain-containing protein n=1 Tax=Candidatus Lambdaproteobacteria bacterium RIFOXYD2_FULL_56_26 TaxID=1817773 RepID=A0A1F6GSG0_9PROT|nr:MAG: hypothetical protein A2557_00450 [Candidatus Lambdaproteobacteria bacterium RIFOXYD2_FULL_56_26]OGH01377.1 MAG: hypothetical protein A2426_13285 [Candidatus Lambdaproteobacteria bacterium RIFOXYC1_FULL_56_13]OGH06918.1 MAG: hypothetical protein A2600_01335 [Candidatus Lambdaproteobacteria bacterium RIFOXYD1_FULL_56_27]
MLSKFITFILIPERTGQVKKARFTFKKLLIYGFIGLLVFSGWAWVMYDYFSIRSRLIDLEESQQTYDEQQKRIEDFYTRFDQAQLHFDHLNSLYEKLKKLTSMTAQSRDRGLGAEGAELKEKLTKATEKGVLEVIASDLSEVDADKKVQEARFARLLDFFKENASPITRLPSGWPVKGYVVNEFGVLQDSFTGQLRPQHGIIIATRAFTPVYAPADGVVQSAGEDEIYGGLIVLDHGNGILTHYGFVSNIEVKAGEVVRRGQTLAQILNNQRTAGPQLYYQVDVNGVPQNPISYINPLSLKD